MPLRIEEEPSIEQAKGCRPRGRSYAVLSRRIVVARVVEVLEWRLVDRVWTPSPAYWAWGMNVTISGKAAPCDLPREGRTASLEEAIEKVNEAWDLWVQYLGLAKTGT